MIDRLLALGAPFWALLGGAFISVAIAIYIDMVQELDLPPGWGIVLASTAAFAACGAAWVGLSMSIERLEGSITSIPRTLGETARRELAADFANRARPRLRRLLVVGVAAGVLGLVLLPVRMAL